MPAYVRIWDVEHGACAMAWHDNSTKLLMIDCGDNTTENWTPSKYLRDTLNRNMLDYLYITNTDQDHLSDLNGFKENNITIRTLARNKSHTPEKLRELKLKSGPLTKDMDHYLHLHKNHTLPTTTPFNDHMGGMKIKTFHNNYPEFTDTNNLSQVIFLSYGNFHILFPGDIEKAGWKVLMNKPGFIEALSNTTILVASHHGRESGYFEDIFQHFTPQAVVISDKPIVHETQLTVPNYRNVVDANGVFVSTTSAWRHVLTTRRDGHITFEIKDNGEFSIYTEIG